MMRRATARAAGSLESDREESGIAIPTLSWPPDPPSYNSLRQGMCYSIKYTPKVCRMLAVCVPASFQRH